MYTAAPTLTVTGQTTDGHQLTLGLTLTVEVPAGTPAVANEAQQPSREIAQIEKVTSLARAQNWVSIDQACKTGEINSNDFQGNTQLTQAFAEAFQTALNSEHPPVSTMIAVVDTFGCKKEGFAVLARSAIPNMIQKGQNPIEFMEWLGINKSEFNGDFVSKANSKVQNLLYTDTLTEATLQKAKSLYDTFVAGTPLAADIVLDCVCSQLKHGNSKMAKRILESLDLEDGALIPNKAKQRRLQGALKDFGNRFAQSLRAESDATALKEVLEVFSHTGVGKHARQIVIDSIYVGLAAKGSVVQALALHESLGVSQRRLDSNSTTLLLHTAVNQVEDKLDAYSKEKAHEQRADAIAGILKLVPADMQEGLAIALIKSNLEKGNAELASLLQHRTGLTNESLRTHEVYQVAVAALKDAPIHKAIGIAQLLPEVYPSEYPAEENFKNQLGSGLFSFNVADFIVAFRLSEAFLQHPDTVAAVDAALIKDLRHCRLPSLTQAKEQIYEFAHALGLDAPRLRNCALKAAALSLEESYIFFAKRILRTFEIPIEELSDLKFVDSARARLMHELQLGHRVPALALVELFESAGIRVYTTEVKEAAVSGFKSLLNDSRCSDTTWIECFIIDPELVQRLVVDKAAEYVRDNRTSEAGKLEKRYTWIPSLAFLPGYLGALQTASHSHQFCNVIDEIAKNEAVPKEALRDAKLQYIEKNFNEGKIEIALNLIEKYELKDHLKEKPSLRAAAAQAIGQKIGEKGFSRLEKCIELFDLKPEELKEAVSPLSIQIAIERAIENNKLGRVDNIVKMFNVDNETLFSAVATQLVANIANGKVDNEKITTRWEVSQDKLEFAAVQRILALRWHEWAQAKKLSEHFTNLASLLQKNEVHVLVRDFVAEQLKDNSNSNMLQGLNEIFNLRNSGWVKRQDVQVLALDAYVKSNDKHRSQSIVDIFELESDAMQAELEKVGRCLLKEGEGEKLITLVIDKRLKCDWLRDSAQRSEVIEGLITCIVRRDLDSAKSIMWRADIGFTPGQQIALRALPYIISNSDFDNFEKILTMFELDSWTPLSEMGEAHADLMAHLAETFELKNIGDILHHMKFRKDDFGGAVTIFKSTTAPADSESPSTEPVQAEEEMPVIIGFAPDTSQYSLKLNVPNDDLDSIMCDPLTVVNEGDIPCHQQQTSYSCGSASSRMGLEAVTGLRLTEREVMEIIDTTEALGTPLGNLNRISRRLPQVEVKVGQNSSWDELKQLMGNHWTILLNYTAGGPHYSTIVAMTDTVVVVHNPNAGAYKILDQSHIQWRGGYGHAAIEKGFCALRRKA